MLSKTCQTKTNSVWSHSYVESEKIINWDKVVARSAELGNGMKIVKRYKFSVINKYNMTTIVNIADWCIWKLLGK